MRNQVFNTFWYGAELPPLHWACLSSFVEQGHELRVWAYQDLRLPSGAILRDAREIISEAELFEFEKSFSAFSNIFRYQLLYDQGGWWVDTDVYCTGRDIPACSYAWAREDEDNINGAILKFPAGDPTLRAILDDAIGIGKNIKVWGELGPHMITKHVAGKEFADHYGTTQAFYPLHWLETHLPWMPGGNAEVEAKCANSPFIHLWGSMFSYYGIDVGISAPEGSFLSCMHQRAHLPRALAPLDAETQARTLESIRTFLGLGWVRKRAQRLFGHELEATIDP
jgi:hypothetical protein